MHFLPRLNLSAGAGTNLSVSLEISTRVGSRWKRVMLVSELVYSIPPIG